MILERTIAPVFAANCYVLAAGPGEPALVVDPGAGAARRGEDASAGLADGALAPPPGPPLQAAVGDDVEKGPHAGAQDRGKNRQKKLQRQVHRAS